MKTIFILILCLCLAAGLTACRTTLNTDLSGMTDGTGATGGTGMFGDGDSTAPSENGMLGNGTPSPSGETGDSQLSNSFVDYDNLDDAADAAGFDFNAPETMDGASSRTIQAVDNQMIQVRYAMGADEVVLRKGVGTDDVSGDNNSYPSMTEKTVDGKTVLLKGDNDRFSLATWNDGDYSYSLYYSAGTDAQTILDLVKTLG